MTDDATVEVKDSNESLEMINSIENETDLSQLNTLNYKNIKERVK